MKRRWSAGYTVLEVMIVLAVSTGLFFMIYVFFVGRTAQTEFDQSVRDLEARLIQISGDVNSGFYNNGFQCSGDSAGSPVIVSSATPVNGGTNNNCIFMGKVAAFSISGGTNILSLVGRQYVAGIGSSSVVSTIAEAKPVLVQTNYENYDFLYQLKPNKILDISNNANTYGALAFATQLSGGVGSSNPLTGGRTVLLYGVRNSLLTNNTPNGIASLINGNPSSLVALSGGARMCLIGGNGKIAQITIGASGNQLGTVVSLDTGATNGC